MVKQEPYAAAVAQILMHDEPQFELDVNFVRQHAEKIGIASRQRDLAAADAATRTQRRQLRKIAVAAEGEHVARQFEPSSRGDPRVAEIAIEADEGVTAQLREIAR
jgi:hypothetical protein